MHRHRPCLIYRDAKVQASQRPGIGPDSMKSYEQSEASISPLPFSSQLTSIGPRPPELDSLITLVKVKAHDTADALRPLPCSDDAQRRAGNQLASYTRLPTLHRLECTSRIGAGRPRQQQQILLCPVREASHGLLGKPQLKALNAGSTNAPIITGCSSLASAVSLPAKAK